MSAEEVLIGQPIKRLEIAIGKFNDVAIPYHLELLKRHKDNVKRFQMNQNWGKVYKEQINAMRVVKQLKQLVYEMDMLRSQVLDRDIFTFDKLTKKARNDAIAAIGEYLGYTGGAFLKKSHISSTESPGIKSVTMLGEGQHSLDSALQQEESKNSKKHL